MKQWNVGWILGFFVIIAFMGAMGEHDSNETKNPQDYVLSYCRDFTKDSLHDSSSVEFDRVYPQPTILPGNKYKMIISLRAKNGFGAMRHFAVECTVRFNGDSWSLVDLKEVN